MQRYVTDGVILACDFCGTDWDMVKPMIEGHRGAILCLGCLAKGIDEADEAAGGFACTLCLRSYAAGERSYRNGSPPEGANAEAVVCWDCLQQADRAFARDRETDWERRIPPDEHWR